MKIKSSDGDEFDVEDEVVKKMETLETMTMLDDDDEQVPTCQVEGRFLKKAILWTDFQNNFKNMDLKNTFEMITTADYLGNSSLSEEMLKKVFLNNSDKDIDEAANQFKDGTIIDLFHDFRRMNEVLVIIHQDELRYLQKGQWITMTKIPNRVCSKKKVCAIKDRVYVIGVDDDTKWTNVAEFNTRTSSWRMLESFEPVWYYINDENRTNTFSIIFFCSVGNKLYIMNYSRSEDLEYSGHCGICALDLDQMDPLWNVIKEDHPYFGASDTNVTVADGCIYLVGGRKYEVEKYDVTQNLWTTEAKLPSSFCSIFGAGIAVLDGKLYVSGGREFLSAGSSTDGIRDTFQCLDFSTNTWTTLAR